MPFYEREEKLLQLLAEREELGTRELAELLYVSVPTVRRDLIKLEARGKLLRVHGGAKAVKKSADEKIPFFLREEEQSAEKTRMAERATRLVRAGNTVLLDGSTSAYHLIPFLAQIPKVVVITSSAKSAFLLGQLGVSNICTGGRMITSSLSYIGDDAERTVAHYNADILFFSCRGLTSDGFLTDNSHEENALRRVMLDHAAKRVLLCDSRKLDTVCLNNLCHLSQIDEVICDKDLPAPLRAMLRGGDR